MARKNINGTFYRQLGNGFWQNEITGGAINSFAFDIIKRFPNGYPVSQPLSSNEYTTSEIWVSSWLPTDPDANVSGFGLVRQTLGLEGGFTSGSLAENMGNVNRFEYIKPAVYFMKCAGDGGFEADYAPVGNQGATGMINASCFSPYNTTGGRMAAIKDRLLELPKGKRSLNPRRYDQGDMYDSSYRAGATYWDNFSNGVTGNIFANSIGATLSNDFRLILQNLKNIGGDVDYITFDMEEVGPKAQYSAGAADALFDARVNAIVADPNYNQPYFTGQTFSQILSEFAGFTLNDILNGNSHPQLNPSYIYWDRAITSNFAAWTSEFLVKPAQLVFPEVDVANYNGYSTGATNDNFFYDTGFHPARFNSVVGDGQSPELYGGIRFPDIYGILISDPTKIYRTDVPGFTTIDGGVQNTAWNNLLVLIQNARSMKRQSPELALRPWIASINFNETLVVTPPWIENSVSRGLYYEMVRHLCLTGTEMFNYWNTNDWTNSLNPYSSPNWFTTNLTRLNNTIADVNNQLGGWRNVALNTTRINFLADYLISGAPINNDSYLWRVTAKPGISLIDEGLNTVTLDLDGGAWITTNTSSIPTFTSVVTNPWTPQQLSDVVLWVDATDASTVTTSGSPARVSEWRDISGNDRHLSQATPNYRPYYEGNLIGGNTAIRFDNSQSTSLRNTFGLYVQPYTWAFVMRTPNTGDFSQSGMIIGSANIDDPTSSVSGVAINYFQNGITWGFNQFAGNGGGAPQGNFTENTNYILVSQFFGITSGYSVNGVNSTVNSGTRSFSGIEVGAWNGNGNPSDTTVGELVVIHTTLTTEDRRLLEGYFAHKWGLTASLPISHPYRYSPPSI